MGNPVRGRGVLPVGFGYSMTEPRLEVFVRCKGLVCVHTPPSPQKKIGDIFRGGGVCTQATEGGRGIRKYILHCISTDFADPPLGFALIIKLSLLRRIP